MQQARRSMSIAFGSADYVMNSNILPWAAYTIPDVAMAGDTEQEVQAAGVDCVVGRAHFKDNPLPAPVTCANRHPHVVEGEQLQTPRASSRGPLHTESPRIWRTSFAAVGGAVKEMLQLTLVATFPVRLSEEIKGRFKTNRCWRSTIRVAKGEREVYGKSVQGLMLLELTAGCDIVI